jgi:hypothetical protein
MSRQRELDSKRFNDNNKLPGRMSKSQAFNLNSIKVSKPDTVFTERFFKEGYTEKIVWHALGRHSHCALCICVVLCCALTLG